MLLNHLVNYMDKTRVFDLYGGLRRKITKSQVIILTYHRTGPMTDKWILNPLIHQEIFEKQMKYLIKNFNIISLNDLTEMIANGKIPEKAVAITFDDGYKDNYEYAFPILKKYDIPATIFLSTGPIEQKKLFWSDEVSYVLLNTELKSIDIEDIGTYQLNSDEDKIKASISVVEKLKKMENNKKEFIIKDLINLTGVNIPSRLGKQNILSWNEIKKMNRNGIDFGAHTVNHPILTNIPLDEAKMEIMNSKNRIEEILNTEVKSFAYPNGDFNEEILSLVRDSGFNSSVTTISGLVNAVNDLYQLNRIDGFKDFHILKLNLCGLWGDLS
ncbi:MAG: polysaccharide deacetylase family protein [Methanobacteriaceae archaeon]|nr:polysaccharide deacetylase family protein [Methanobacteriaceae archaeon]